MDGLKLSRQAMYVWAAVGILYVAVVAATGLADRPPPQEAIIRACFTKQIVMCGDLLCESSDSDVPEHIIRSMYHIQMACLVQPDMIEERYYNSTLQKEVLDDEGMSATR